ncbi:alpha/beta hydrolase [Planococcus sp. CP5-4]|uniref:alpha/beta fold hydrolase n=1 Tax=unclassified Planococcus (in: firmicutes) TaxID=2662419 RepID=UPI001C213E56|nr:MULTISPECIES: alpha/beta hydrolase [unclassified Planococcus (in: firmicutes)]MBU9675071.1 alpha/beta hydrolase [Planococcus sp. CP5-4_YE]MBV0910160.1 alpha/beta hydrolase [Planococcus sp. CP5-4_UN]MBW6064633.1 alpha/beta hydrolase [Planococcus sp. CP5-4]
MKSLVHLNGRPMEVLQKGGVGTPILIMTGMSCSFEEWFNVTEILCETHKVILFHRPGLGASELGTEPRTTAAAAQDAKNLLDVLGVTEPVVLIGHSYGGLCAQHFSKLYPQQVKGLLLVDSTSDSLEKLDELPDLAEDASDDIWLEECGKFAELDENELKKVIRPMLSENQKKLPRPIQQRLIEFQQKPNLYKAMKSEVENWRADAKIIKSLGSLSSLPLIVIGRDMNYAVEQGVEEGWPEAELMAQEHLWHELIQEQSALSENSELVFVERAGHMVHLDRPDLVIAMAQKLTRPL